MHENQILFKQEIYARLFLLYNWICNDLFVKYKLTEKLPQNIFNCSKRTLKELGVSVPGIGHSDIRGLVTYKVNGPPSSHRLIRVDHRFLCANIVTS